MSKHTGCYIKRFTPFNRIKLINITTSNKSRMKFMTNIWCGYLSRHVTQIFNEKYIGIYCFVNFLAQILKLNYLFITRTIYFSTHIIGCFVPKILRVGYWSQGRD